jgi:hypothetical protein
LITFKLKLSTIFGVLGLIVMGLTALAISIPELQNDANLKDNQKEVRGSVTENRVTHDSKRNFDNYELQYTFKIPPSSDLYTLSDATGRKNLWSTLTKQDWDDARKNRTLTIIYLPDNPWVNRPKSQKYNPHDDAIFAAITISGIPLLIAFLISYMAFVERKKLILVNANGQTPPKNLSWYKTDVTRYKPVEISEKQTVLESELSTATDKLEIYIQSDSKHTKVIKTKIKKPQNEDYTVNSEEPPATPIILKDQFTDNINGSLVNIIKDENADKFEGMF